MEFFINKVKPSQFMQPEIRSQNWMVQSVELRWHRHQSSHGFQHESAVQRLTLIGESTRDSGYLVQYAIRTMPPTPVLFTRPQSERSPGAAWVRCQGWPSLCGCARPGPEIENHLFRMETSAVFHSKGKELWRKIKWDIGGKWGQSHRASTAVTLQWCSFVLFVLKVDAVEHVVSLAYCSSFS